jgi:hypothetical protein
VEKVNRMQCTYDDCERGAVEIVQSGKVLWDVAPCSLVEVLTAVNASETSVNFTRLHCASSQKTLIFILTTART